MKKLVFIEANTTGTGMLSLEKAQNYNLESIFITNNPNRYNGLYDKGCKVIICDTNSIVELIHVIESEVPKQELIGITTTSDFYIHMVSRLTKYFNLVGNSPEVTELARDKSKVRLLFEADQELYTPFFKVVKSIDELDEIKDIVPFPCIVKPVDESGSNKVKKCINLQQLNDHIREILSIKKNIRNQSTAQTVLIEEYIQGQEYSIECISFKGSHQIVGITEKTVCRDPHFVEKGHIFPSPNYKSLEPFIQKGAINILDKIGWEYGPSHIEVKVKNNKLFLVEFNGRLAGGLIPELISLSTGNDLLLEQIKVSIGEEPYINQRPKQFAGIRFFVPETSGVVKIDDKYAQYSNIHDLYLKVQDDSEVEQVKNAYGRIGHCIAFSKDVDCLTRILNDVENTTVKIKEKERTRP